MSEQEKCSQCLLPFCQQNVPRSMPSCAHNICTKCLKEAIQHRQQFIDCAFCAKKVKRREIKLFPKNLKTMHKMKQISFGTSRTKSEQLLLGTSKISYVDAHSKFLEDEDLLGDVDAERSILHELNADICTVHEKNLDIICATDKKRICPHCAIFGNHKDHRFRTVSEFEQEVKETVKVFSEITSKKERIFQTEYQSDFETLIQAKIQKRRDILLKEVRSNFERVVAELQMRQKEIQSELIEKFEQSKKTINREASCLHSSQEKYKNWQRECESIIESLENTGDLETRIQLFYGSPLEISKEGQFFLDQMLSQIESTLREVSERVNSICMEVEEVKFSKFISLIFPLLDNKPQQIDAIQTVSQQKRIAQKPFESPAKAKIGGQYMKLVQRQTLKPKLSGEGLEDNSFIFEEEISSIMQREVDVKTAKKNGKSNNRSITSPNPFNMSMFSSNSSALSPPKQKPLESKKKANYLLSRVKSNPRFFKSPELSKTRVQRPAPRKDPKEVLEDFCSSDLITELDLSQMGMLDEQIAHLLETAHKKSHAFKALKLQKNRLSDEGFESICEWLKGLFNVNLSHNCLTEKSLESLLKNKDCFSKLRIINFSNNKIGQRSDKKVKCFLEELKRMGVTVTL